MAQSAMALELVKKITRYRDDQSNGALGMRAYVIVSGLAFFVLALSHVARLVAEGAGPLHEPTVLVTSLISLGLAVWAAMTVRILKRSSSN